MNVNRRLDNLEAAAQQRRRAEGPRMVIRFVGRDLVTVDGQSMTESEFNEQYPDYVPDEVMQFRQRWNYDD